MVNTEVFCGIFSCLLALSTGTWVHIEGETSPKFDSTGHVTGLDTAGTFLAEFKEYLDDAHARHILIFPTLWNGALKQHKSVSDHFLVLPCLSVCLSVPLSFCLPGVFKSFLASSATFSYVKYLV